MDNGFTFDDERNSKGILKKVLIILGAVFGVVAMVLVVCLSGIFGNNDACRRISEKTGINRCDNHFRQVIFVIGDTANTPKPSLDQDGQDIITYLYDDSSDGISFISVANPDGTPQLFKKNKTKKISEEIANSVANVNGADYIEAIRNTAIYSRNKEDTLIYVIGSGLSDRGLLNFADNNLLIEYSTEEIKSAVSSDLSEKSELKGLTIYWDGLGNTVLPQEPLPAILKRKEEDIYRAVLGEMGVAGDSLVFVNKAGKNEINDVNTTVKTTSIISEELTFEYYGNSELAFVGGTAEFMNPGAAEAEIKRLASRYKNAYFVIKPFMSRGMCDRGKNPNLLNARAEATKNLFINAGHVSSSDIIIEEGEIGDAPECPGGEVHGPVDETEAVKNRKVRISVIRK